MRYEDEAKRTDRMKLWQAYCGFLDLNLDDYMFIQKRLMQEQISNWTSCALGQKLLAASAPPPLRSCAGICR
jgi:hypothetical protein